MSFNKLFCFFGLALVLPAYLYAASGLVTPEQQSELRGKNAQIKSIVQELDNIGKELIVAKARDEAAIDLIDKLELDADRATVRLEALQKIDRETPDTIAPEKIHKAEEANKQAITALNDAKGRREMYADGVGVIKSKAIEKYAEFQRLEKSFERSVDVVVNTQVDQRILSLQAAKEVVATARVACGDETIKQCKERAIKAAELTATEQGAVVFVTSLTEVKNFKLSKDEIRSEVQATLTNKEIVKQQMIGEAEGYEITLKARVEPVIGDTLRGRMEEGIRSEIYSLAGGQLDYTQIPDPSAADEASAPPKKDKKKSETDARARIEAQKAARAEEAQRRAAEAAQAEEDRRREAEAAQAEEQRRKAAQEEDARRKAEQERERAANAEKERRRSGIPTMSF